ncbi:hypothetical protein PAMC26510_33310 [Caballeronia sordidicola]|uniref:Uncharacterized protein n=1 Tax=Caballeronia sordidicola TaxID=196367 RepID=A0A242M699_CABSO|nr:hypothetical protein PAMC26510_33310 [Caballeronia sordidicola]
MARKAAASAPRLASFATFESDGFMLILFARKKSAGDKASHSAEFR